MKSLLGVIFFTTLFSSMSYADEVPCKYTVESNVYDSRYFSFDADGEAVLFHLGKEVTRNPHEAHLRIYLGFYYDTEWANFKQTKLKRTNQRVTLTIRRNIDSVALYKKTIKGDASYENKEKLLEALSKLEFRCSNS